MSLVLFNWVKDLDTKQTESWNLDLSPPQNIWSKVGQTLLQLILTILFLILSLATLRGSERQKIIQLIKEKLQERKKASWSVGDLCLHLQWVHQHENDYQKTNWLRGNHYTPGCFGGCPGRPQAFILSPGAWEGCWHSSGWGQDHALRREEKLECPSVLQDRHPPPLESPEKDSKILEFRRKLPGGIDFEGVWMEGVHWRYSYSKLVCAHGF